jgi:hypothetical protein
MSFARRLEALLESAVDRVAGAVFPGSIQPAELGGRVVRAVDLATTEDELGPSAPNVVEIGVHPADLPEDLPTEVLDRGLSAALEDEAARRGWRLGGPAAVRIVAADDVPRGHPRVRTGRRAGARPAWGHLAAADERHPLTDNRILVGRADDADVRLTEDSVSRRHALLWREDGAVRITDLGSANGTRVGGRPITGPTVLGPGVDVVFGSVVARIAER